MKLACVVISISMLADPGFGNAVLRHQLNQQGFPTSGISTTPVYERVAFYATAGGAQAAGFVYKIDRELLTHNGVRECVVSAFTNVPSVSDDQKVILVSSDGGALPEAIAVDAIGVGSVL